MSRNELSLNEMYGSQDLGASPLFAGDYINFGLWESTDPMTVDGRAKASERLYDGVVDHLLLTGEDVVLEVGCGRGVGLRRLVSQKKAARGIGVDATPDQVLRASGRNREKSIQFLLGKAEALPVAEASVSAIFSVEAAQHFSDIPSFVSEMKRVLTPSGRFALTTFFLCPNADIGPLAELIPTVRDQIDRPMDVAKFQELLIPSFEVQMESIGGRVWPYFDHWISLHEKNDWGRNWRVAWERGLIDYYVISGSLR